MLCQPCDLGLEMVECWSGAHPHVPSLPRPMHHVLFGPRPPSCPQPALHLSVQLSPPSSKSRRLRSPTTPLHLRLPSSLARCLAHMYPACRTANPSCPWISIPMTFYVMALTFAHALPVLQLYTLLSLFRAALPPSSSPTSQYFIVVNSALPHVLCSSFAV